MLKLDHLLGAIHIYQNKKSDMLKYLLTAMVCLGFALPSSGQDDAIASAASAAPTSISDNARIVDWGFNELRPGTNEWTCLPDNPDTTGNDPMCVTVPWLNLLNAYVNKEEPTYDAMGIAYMLGGDAAVSNSDPYATEPTGPEDWVDNLGAHLMIVLPDRSLLESFPTDHRDGGPWVMWPDTPYAHLMVPIDSRFPEGMMHDMEHH